MERGISYTWASLSEVGCWRFIYLDDVQSKLDSFPRSPSPPLLVIYRDDVAGPLEQGEDVLGGGHLHSLLVPHLVLPQVLVPTQH